MFDFNGYMFGFFIAIVSLWVIIDPNSIATTFQYCLDSGIASRAIAVISCLIITSLTVHLASKVLGGR